LRPVLHLFYKGGLIASRVTAACELNDALTNWTDWDSHDSDAILNLKTERGCRVSQQLKLRLWPNRADDMDSHGDSHSSALMASRIVSPSDFQSGVNALAYSHTQDRVLGSSSLARATDVAVVGIQMIVPTEHSPFSGESGIFFPQSPIGPSWGPQCLTSDAPQL